MAAPWGIQDLVHWPRIKAVPPAVGAWSPKHWQVPPGKFQTMLFLSQNAADRCLIIVPEAFIFSFFNDREVVIAATSLTLAHLLFNKEDKPEAVHLQKTAEGPERRRREDSLLKSLCEPS